MDKAPLTSHLGELRNRIVITLIAVLIAFCASFYFSETIFRLLTLPLHYTIKISLDNPYFSFVPGQFFEHKLNVLRPAEALWTHIKISFIAAFIFSSPVIFYEIWRFIAPGLLEKERKYAFPFVFTTTFLFLTGSLFCFGIVLPFAMNFLQNYKMENLQFSWTIGYYIDFCLKFILAFGAIFELPVIVVFLT
ncbi:MAG: twin-arginine translocase subunit TatC, partial [Nitrospirota bacterium]